MWIAIYIVAAIGVIVWFVRTPLFRAHLRQGKDPGEGGTRMDRKFGALGGTYNRPEKPR
jgi:hypothetical protein